MDVLAPTDVIDWSVDFAQAVVSVAWAVVPSGTVTATAAALNEANGTATALIAGNSAPLGNVYQVTCTATIAGGVTDVRTITYRVGPKAAN